MSMAAGEFVSVSSQLDSNDKRPLHLDRRLGCSRNQSPFAREVLYIVARNGQGKASRFLRSPTK
jgi:hypothetical protein